MQKNLWSSVSLTWMNTHMHTDPGWGLQELEQEHRTKVWTPTIPPRESSRGQGRPLPHQDTGHQQCPQSSGQSYPRKRCSQRNKTVFLAPILDVTPQGPTPFQRRVVTALEKVFCWHSSPTVLCHLPGFSGLIGSILPPPPPPFCLLFSRTCRYPPLPREDKRGAVSRVPSSPSRPTVQSGIMYNIWMKDSTSKRTSKTTGWKLTPLMFEFDSIVSVLSEEGKGMKISPTVSGPQPFTSSDGWKDFRRFSRSRGRKDTSFLTGCWTGVSVVWEMKQRMWRPEIWVQTPALPSSSHAGLSIII